ncbi:MAG: TonB-dependent receptor plug domain-containing protein [Candidatus Riflebacteria bacterium]
MLKKMICCVLFSLFFPVLVCGEFSGEKLPESPSISFVLDDIEVFSEAFRLPEEITGQPDFSAEPESGVGRNLTTVSEFLDQFAQLTVRIPGGPGHIASPNIGGLGGNKIIVVKDGMPVNDPFTGSADIGDLTLDSFDSVDVWQGNRATLWGSGGVGGIIRLNSRFPESGRMKYWYDGVGGNGFSLETAVETENARFGVRAARFYTPGWSAASSQRGNTEADRFEVEDLGLAFATELGKGWHLDGRGSFRESMTWLDGFDIVTSLPADSLTFRQKKTEGESSFGLMRTDKRGEWRLSQSFIHRSYTGSDEAAPWNAYGLEVSRHRQSVSRMQNQSDSVTLLAELSRMETLAVNHGNFRVREVESGFLAGYEQKFKTNSLLNFSARLDNPDTGDSVFTGHFSYSFEYDLNRMVLQAGTAFRNPSLNERFFPNYGDAGLQAEHSFSQQIEISRGLGDSCRVGVSMMKYQIRDLIGTVATSDPAYAWGIKAENLNRADILSHEIWLRNLSVGAAKINASVTLLDRAKLLDSGMQPPGTPSRRAMISVSRRMNDFDLEVQSKWWGQTWENAQNTVAAEPGNDLNLVLSGKTGPARISLSCLNLLDEEKERLVGYTRPGRRFLVSSEIAF